MLIRVDIELKFEEAVFGIDKEIEVIRRDNAIPVAEQRKPGTDVRTCGNCNGTGQVQYTQNTPLGRFVNVNL